MLFSSLSHTSGSGVTAEVEGNEGCSVARLEISSEPGMQEHEPPSGISHEDWAATPPAVRTLVLCASLHMVHPCARPKSNHTRLAHSLVTLSGAKGLRPD